MLGHDSEFGLLKDGKPVSAIEHLKRGRIKGIGRFFPDNLNAEIAIDPCNTLVHFHSRTEALLDQIKELGFELEMSPVIDYGLDAIKNKRALVSGCNPDYNAYSREKNLPPNFKNMTGVRSCGAHVHIGEPDINPWTVSKWMDALIAIPLLFREKKSERRSLYGAAGCLRVKPYGVEYRTLSNVWLDSYELRTFVWEMSHKAVEASKKYSDNLLDSVTIQNAINNHDLNMAEDIMDRMYIYGVTSCI